MTDASRIQTVFRARLVMYYVFILAYLTGALDFAFEFHNYWACGGFSVAILLILLRVWLFVMPQYRLYQMFPPCSFSRTAFQVFFLGTCFGGIGLGVWLMVRGIQDHQSWTGSSYFCGMIGVWMAAKWGYFVTVPIYELREDTLEEESLIKLGLLEPRQESDEGTHEPAGFQEAEA